MTVLLGTGSGGFVAGTPVAVGVRALGLVIAELTGDESPDLAVACATTNSISVAAGRGDGTFDPPVTVAAGVFARALAVGDFDGDTQADLAVANGNGNDAWIVLNRSGALADLAVAVDNGASTVDAGAPVSYAVAVSNLGPATVDAVALDLDLPAALQGASYTPSAGTFDANTGAWSGLDLASGAEVTLTVTGIVAPSASGTFTVAAAVSPAAGVTDPSGANNTASDSDPVIRGEADLAVSITNGTGSVAAGDAVTYTIVARQRGPVGRQRRGPRGHAARRPAERHLDVRRRGRRRLRAGRAPARSRTRSRCRWAGASRTRSTPSSTRWPRAARSR